jgi:hypothetical protein
MAPYLTRQNFQRIKIGHDILSTTSPTRINLAIIFLCAIQTSVYALLTQVAVYRGRSDGGAEDVPGDTCRRTKTRNKGHYASRI